MGDRMESRLPRPCRQMKVAAWVLAALVAGLGWLAWQYSLLDDNDGEWILEFHE